MSPCNQLDDVISTSRRGSSLSRREQARDSARVRRAAEGALFQKLERLLGLSSGKQDKATIIRLAMAALKAEKIVKQIAGTTSEDQTFHENEAMTGILMIITHQMEVVTVSENIISLLGITLVDILGSSFYEFLHPCDHKTFKSVFSKDKKTQNMTMRVKNLLQESGRMVSKQQAGYKVFTVQGKVLSVKGQPDSFCCYLSPVFSYSSKILSRHLPCMKIESCSPWFLEKGGYNVQFLRENSLFQFVHPADVVELKDSVTTVREMGEAEISPFRFLLGSGGYVWLSTVVRWEKFKIGGKQEERILCNHTVIS